MTEKKPYTTYIYLSTDSNEVREIIERGGKNPPLLDRDYTTDYVRINKNIYPITNLLPKVGADIKRTWGLLFNPMSVVFGKIDPEDKDTLAERLVSENLWVDVVEDGKIKSYRPKDREE